MAQPQDGGEAILEAFRNLGVDYIISSPGSEWAPVWDALARQKVNGTAGPTYINCWHETLAMDMALGYTRVTGKMQAVLLHAGSILHFLDMGPGILRASFILLMAVMLLSMLFGVASLVALNTGASGTSEAYVRRLRRVLIWQYLPILGWVIFLSLTAAPTEIPFAGSLGLAQLEHSLNIGTLSASASVGFWLPFAALWVGAIKGNDL